MASSNPAKILVSACLLGSPVRFDGRGKPLSDPRIARWLDEGRLITICPEVAGGLTVPRPAAERRGNLVITREGVDVTEPFRTGARHAVAAARASGARLALLKARSPSCGPSSVYDGSFTGRIVPGEGTTAAALREAGLSVYDETQLDALEAALEG